MKPVVRAVLRGSLKDVRHVRAVAPGDARGLARQVYGELERDFGVIAPPVALHSPAAPVLAAAWTLLREVLLVEGRVGRAAKEIVATEVSRANACPYCVDVHQATLGTLPAPPAGTVDGLAEWARGSGLAPAAGGTPAVPPFAADEAPELYGTAVVFHYINRMVHLYLADSPVPEQAPGFLRGTILRTAAKAMRPSAGGPLAPGAALDLLPDAPLPEGLDWARGNPSVAGAFGRAVAAVTGAAAWVPSGVQELLAARLAQGDGTAPGPSRAWVEEAVTGLSAAERPVARLALLTALAPYQAVDADVAAFRERHATDRELIELTSWAALAVALHVGARFTTPAPAA